MSEDRYCPRCGAPLETTAADDGAPRQACTRCGRVHYRNSKPCVGAVLLDTAREHVLLARRARDPHAGLWDLPGGFLEWAEAPEDGLRRELQEETGLKVEVLSLLGAWVGRYADEATLNLAYACRIPAGETPSASSDVAELRWWPVSALPQMAFPHEREAVLKASIQPA